MAVERRRVREVVRRVAGALSLAAAAVHGGLAPAHIEEWWGYGLVFLAAAASQAVLGLALLVDPLPPEDPAAPRLRRWTYASGAVGNVALVALYVATRLVAIPVGPDPHVEEVDALGVLAVASETAVVALLATLLIRRS